MMRLSDSVEGPIEEIKPFHLSWPDRLKHKLMLASPHSGRAYPSCFLKNCCLNQTTLRRAEDFCIDSLYDFAPRMDIPLLAAQFPRSFVDVNRSASEIDPALLLPTDQKIGPALSKRVANGLGVVPRVVGAGLEIHSDPIGLSKVRERLEQFHKPYHERLGASLENIKNRLGAAVLIDCHSMPDTVSTRRVGSSKSNDIVLGDRFGASCSHSLTDAAEECLTRLGYRVVRNDPYAGGYTTTRYGKPDFGCHSLQIEINRRLYMDERRLRLTNGYDQLKADLKVFVAEMITIADALSSPGHTSIAAE